MPLAGSCVLCKNISMNGGHSMSYAVLQTGSEPPSTEQLKHAFRGVRGLTELDAYTVGKDAFGLLAKGFGLEPAQALKHSLAAQGIAAEVVDETVLPVLPDSFFLTRMDCTEKALLVYDAIGRVAEVAWTDVLLIAAGTVVMTEFKQVPAAVEPSVQRGLDMMADLTRPKGFRRRDFLEEIAAHALPDIPRLDIKTREEQHQRLIIEIILAGAVTRYTVRQDRMTLLFFQYLGERRTTDVYQNFSLLIRDLVQHSADAAINRGAYYLKENDATPFQYPNKVAFYNEMVWLLWRKALSPPAT
jgi:hypothetical protein